MLWQQVSLVTDLTISPTKTADSGSDSRSDISNWALQQLVIIYNIVKAIVKAIVNASVNAIDKAELET